MLYGLPIYLTCLLLITFGKILRKSHDKLKIDTLIYCEPTFQTFFLLNNFIRFPAERLNSRTSLSNSSVVDVHEQRRNKKEMLEQANNMYYAMII